MGIIKELFRDFYKSHDYETANQLLKEWLQLAWSSPFSSFHEVAKTIENWRIQFCNTLKHRLQTDVPKVPIIRSKT
ncbi:transposase [Neobacillus pocheonensis]|uniref:Transposase n=1 Tax=Neobacillus pocheonensis TaxID=363869 RepID=A0ABT0WE85_9BACI|nr:transposase [Neobacillus pocheonensis]